MKFLVAEKYKSCEIYRKMCVVYGEASFSQKMIHKWAKLFNESQNGIQDENWPGRHNVEHA